MPYIDEQGRRCTSGEEIAAKLCQCGHAFAVHDALPDGEQPGVVICRCTICETDCWKSGVTTAADLERARQIVAERKLSSSAVGDAE